MAFFEPFQLERFFAKHEFSARYLLCSSDCESFPVRELLAMEDGALDRLLDLRLGYTETRGAPALRAAIAGLYAGLGPEGIMAHAGAEEAILNLFLATVKAGDRVVVNFPCYQSLSEIPASLGCDVVRWPLREAGDEAIGTRWFLDPDELEALSGGKARVIVMNVPHNPTGALLRRDEFEAVVGYARKTGAILVVDEVYRRLERNQAERLPSVCEEYENGVAVDVLSKHSGLAGLRIGWLATRRADILDEVAVVKDYNSICASAPSELLAEIAVKNVEAIAARNRGIIARNLALFDHFLATRPDFARWSPPAAGSVGFPQLCSWPDAEELAERLVSEAGVLILPGKYYGYDASFFRVGLGRANLPEALGRLEEWLASSGCRLS